jgi:hypothetical protein
MTDHNQNVLHEDTLYNIEILCTTLRYFIQHWDTLYNIEILCTTLRWLVQHWDTLYNIEMACTTLRYFIQHWDGLYNIEMVCTTLRYFIQHWDGLYNIEMVCTTLRYFVQHWDTLYNIEMVCGAVSFLKFTLDRKVIFSVKSVMPALLAWDVNGCLVFGDSSYLAWKRQRTGGSQWATVCFELFSVACYIIIIPSSVQTNPSLAVIKTFAHRPIHILPFIYIM